MNMTLSVLSSDDVMIMSVFGGSGGDDDDNDASLCKSEMECSNHYHVVFD